MTLYVVRHAHAGQRSSWDGDDSRRPLSEKGAEQALGIADRLTHVATEQTPRRLVSSPAVRCVQTLEPTARKLGLEVTTDDRLGEGATSRSVESLLADLADEPTVWCSHGDVVPLVLRRLNELGMQTDRNLVWQKASTWVIARVDGAWTTGTYLPPPGKLV